MNINRINKLIDNSKKKLTINENSLVKSNITKIRKLYEQGNRNLKTVYDQSNEERKFRSEFDDLNIIVDFIPLKIYDNYVFWGGTIDGMIQFVYKITPNEKNSGVTFNYTDDFSADDPDNEEIVKRIEKYYDIFYEYWRNNIFN